MEPRTARITIFCSYFFRPQRVDAIRTLPLRRTNNIKTLHSIKPSCSITRKYASYFLPVPLSLSLSVLRIEEEIKQKSDLFVQTLRIERKKWTIVERGNITTSVAPCYPLVFLPVLHAPLISFEFATLLVAKAQAHFTYSRRVESATSQASSGARFIVDTYHTF